MDKTKSLFILRDYGKIKLKFKDVMDAKEMSRNRLATAAGIRFEVANRLYKGETERMDLDVLAKVLCVLNCKVEDVLVYEK